MIRIHFLFIAAISVLFLFWEPVNAQQASVVINELAWAGSSESFADEWIELKNNSDTEVDISGWEVARLSGGEEELMIQIPEGETIPAHSFYLIANYEKSESALDIEPDFVDTSVSLSNSSLEIKLYDGSFGSAGLIDTAGNGEDPPAGSNDTPKASMERVGDSFGTATKSVNFDQGIEDLGTPGAENSATQAGDDEDAEEDQEETVDEETEQDDEASEEESSESAEKSASIEKDVALRASEVTTNSATLDWKTYNFTPSGFHLWEKHRNTREGRKITSTTKNIYKLTNLNPGRTYYFQVEAISEEGEIMLSNKLEVTTEMPDPKLVISEVFPGSKNADGFIEFESQLSAGFFGKLTLATQTDSYELGESIRIAQTADLFTYRFPESLIDPDTRVHIRDSEERSLATLNIPDGPKNYSFAKAKDNNYYWTAQPTPDKENVVLTQAMLDESGAEVVSPASSSAKTPETESIAVRGDQQRSNSLPVTGNNNSLVGWLWTVAILVIIGAGLIKPDEV